MKSPTRRAMSSVITFAPLPTFSITWNATQSRAKIPSYLPRCAASLRLNVSTDAMISWCFCSSCRRTSLRAVLEDQVGAFAHIDEASGRQELELGQLLDQRLVGVRRLGGLHVVAGDGRGPQDDRQQPLQEAVIG